MIVSRPRHFGPPRDRRRSRGARLSRRQYQWFCGARSRAGSATIGQSVLSRGSDDELCARVAAERICGAFVFGGFGVIWMMDDGCLVG
jgi:hypothetical protein